jgi:hypothetical protein
MKIVIVCEVLDNFLGSRLSKFDSKSLAKKSSEKEIKRCQNSVMNNF